MRKGQKLQNPLNKYKISQNRPFVPRLAESRLPRVPSDSISIPPKTKPSTPAPLLHHRRMEEGKEAAIPGRIQTQQLEELDMDPTKLPPLHFLRNCIPGRNPTIPLTMLLPIQLCREMVLHICDAGLIQTEGHLSTVLLLSPKQLSSLQFYLPTHTIHRMITELGILNAPLIELVSDYAFIPRYIFLEDINNWLCKAFQIRQELKRCSNYPLFCPELKSSSSYDVKVRFDPDRIAQMNFLNGMKSFQGGEYMHSIPYLDCRQWDERNCRMNLPQLVFKKFRFRASHRNCRHNDLMYVDLSGCDLSNVNGDELARILQDVNCQAAVYGIHMDDILRKLPRISIAYLSLENVTFTSDTRRERFLKALTPLLLDSHFYYIDLCGWNSYWVERCFKQPDWFKIKPKCLY